MVGPKDHSPFPKLLTLTGYHLSGLHQFTGSSAEKTCRRARVDSGDSEAEWETDLTLTAVVGSVLLAIFLMFGH